jgi:IPT/TIG domain-containing protein
MSAPGPALGYKPLFHMPMIAPPPAGQDAEQHYNNVNATANVRVTAAANQALDVLLSDASYNAVHAVSGGFVTFIPPGSPLPTQGQEPSPGTGALMLQSWGADVTELKRVAPTGVPPWATVFYGNVDPASVRAQLLPVVQKLSQAHLETSWQVNHPATSAPRADLENDYLDRLLRSEVTVFVPGGQQLGEASRVNPADSASDTSLSFLFLDAAGGYLSPLAHLRDMPHYAAPNWEHHPLITATANIAVPVNIHLKFEVWENGANNYVPLPAGIGVDLMDYDPVGEDDVLLTQSTDAQGCVHFSVPDIHAIEESEPDIYFRLHLNGRSHAGHTLPQQWSTKGWLATDGSPGYYENFNGTQLGDAATPVVFRVGLDWHLRLTYEDKSKPGPIGAITVTDGSTSVTGIGTDFKSYHVGRTLRVAGEPTGYIIDNVPSTTGLVLKQPYSGATRSGQPYTIDPPAPKGIPVGIHTGPPRPPSTPAKQLLRTDENGEAHGISFDVQADETVYFRVNFEIEDVSINLPRASVAMTDPASPAANDEGWPTYYSDADQKYFPDMQKTSIGSLQVPEIVRCTTGDRNVALYLLKLLRELSTFLFHITAQVTVDRWAGILNLRLFRTALFGEAYSWPMGEVNFPPVRQWDRPTIMHEMCHQVMWKEAQITTVDVLSLAVSFELYLPHFAASFYNPTHALIEGWPDFTELIFENHPISGYPYSVARLYDFDQALRSQVGMNPGPPTIELHMAAGAPRNRGESVEGAFANSLWGIWKNHVTSGATATAQVPESLNGDVTTTAPWIRDPLVQQRFYNMIWRPLRELRNNSDSDKTTSTMIAHVRSRNASVWHSLHPEFQAFNAAMNVPALTSVAPTQGSIAGGYTVTLTGDHFVTGMRVDIASGRVPASDTRVLSRNTIEITMPSGPGVGRFDVVVTTPAGSSAPKTFEYR